MKKYLPEGLARGLLLGLVYAWADTLFVYSIARKLMEMRWDPFTETTLHIFVWDLCIALGLSLVFSLVAGRILLEKPTRFVHALALGLVITNVVASPEFDQIFALGLGGIGMMHGLGYALTRFVPGRIAKQYLVLPALAIVWGIALSLGLASPRETGADLQRPVPVQGSPNVLFVIFDTTRADRLALYGHSRQTTPNVDRLAREGAVFDRAYSTAPWTMASHSSMFTGMYSARHWCNHSHLYLNGNRVTVAEILRDKGYETAVFAGNPWFGDHSGIIQGFMELVPSWRNFTLYNLFSSGRLRIMAMPGGQDKGGLESNAGFKRWYDTGRDKDRPFFAFVNYLEAHAPYHQVPYEDARRFLAPDVTWKEADEVSRRFMSRMMFATTYEATDRDRQIAFDLYDGGIYNADRRLGELLEHLAADGSLDNTLVIVGADHGELFGEHQLYGHDVALYHPLVHVPLVMRYPGHVPQNVRIDKPVQMTDLFSTILDFTGIQGEPNQDVRSQSVRPLLEGGGDPERPMFAEFYPTRMRPLVTEIKRMGFEPESFYLSSVQVRDHRMIRWPGSVDRVFDVSSDPGELTDIKDHVPEAYELLKAQLAAFHLQNPPALDDSDPDAPSMDSETREVLKSLGYVQ